MVRALASLLWISTAAPQSVADGPGCPASGWADSVPVEVSSAAGPNCSPPSGNLPFFYDLYTFRGEGGRTSIVAAYAVEEDNLRREKREGGVQYRLVVSLVLADTATASVSRTDDSVTIRLPRRPPGHHLLRTHMEVQAPPSSSTLQRVIVSDVTTPGFGQLYHGPFPIPDYRGSHLMLSDIALGEPGAEGGWKRDGVSLSLLPTGRLREGAFNLYYEVYNLPHGHDYSTEIVIERLDGGEGGVHTRFSGESMAGPDAVLQELRRVESRLRQGGYRLTVTVRDEVTGQTAERSRRFRIGGGED